MLVDATRAASKVPYVPKGKRKLLDALGEAPSSKKGFQRFFEERKPADMSQEEFGHKYGVGGQAMVWQYISGHRALGAEAAAKFAKGLNCTIADISPSLAAAIKAQVRKLNTDILPILGAGDIVAGNGERDIGVPTDVVRERFINENEELELIRTFRRTSPKGQAEILNAARTMRTLYPLAANIVAMEAKVRRRKK